MAIRSAIQQPLDWQHLQHLANYHGVLPFAYQRLKEVAPDMVPPEDMHDMAAFGKANELRVSLMTGDLVQAVRALEAEDIPVLCLKGPTLATLLHGDPAMRCFGDLDLLVPQSDYSRAEAVLHKLGLQPIVDELFIQQTTTNRASAIEYHRLLNFPHHQYYIELHWRISPGESPVALDTAGLFARSRQVLVLGQSLPTLSDIDIVLHVCQHGTTHSWMKLRYLVDFASALSLAEATGWEALLKVAREQDLLRPMWVALHLCHEFIGSDLPEKALRASRPNLLTQWAVQLTQTNIIASSPRSGSGLAGLVLRLAIAKKRYQVLLPELKTMFTPTMQDYQWIALPNSLRWLYPALRPFRRIGKSLALILRCRKSLQKGQ